MRPWVASWGLGAFAWIGLALGCGSGDDASAPATHEPAPTEAPTEATEAPTEATEPDTTAPDEPEEVVEALPTPALPEVDLLHAAPARVSVSTVYRDNAEQVARMVDGDLATAWNSRTGDLVGAWIEVEVPAEATVRALAITPGFVRRSDTADLFTGNHRIARVRVTAFDGGVATTVGESPLDVESRDLVEVPVGRAGGRFRVEVLETRPGTREDWREICVSELRVLGALAGATPGEATPQTSVGALGPAGALDDEAAQAAAEAAEDAAADAQLEALDREMALDSVSSLIDDWDLYAGMVMPTLEGVRVSDSQRARQQEQRARRAGVLGQAAELVAEADAPQAARLRERAASGYSLWDELAADLDAILAAGDTVIAPFPEHACAWANLRALARLRHYAFVVDTATYTIEGQIEDGELDGFPLDARGRARLREELAEVRAIHQVLDRMHVDELETVSAALRRRLQDMAAPTSSWVTSSWTALGTELTRAGTAC
ncbi:MAG: hypothetical protein H6719_18460 [Sandaracinaceae bacterium]|nr:hypothetical protein [Sandaracinaceae bacterium]